MPSHYQTIERALRFLDEHQGEHPSLTEVAEAVGMSDAHLHRLFRDWAGITPKDFLQVLTLVKAKRLLQDEQSVLAVSHAVGLSGGGRLHDLFVTMEAMTPGEFKARGKGLAIFWDLAPTPFGEAVFAATSRGLCALHFVADKDVAGARALLKAEWPQAELLKSAEKIAPYVAGVAERMRGAKGSRLAILLKGSPFQVKIWQALLSIPEGQVVTYQELAEAAGMPKAARAVGTAIASNHLAYLIPCHRVIRATGVTGEYRWGKERKQVLLAAERARKA